MAGYFVKHRRKFTFTLLRFCFVSKKVRKLIYAKYSTQILIKIKIIQLQIRTFYYNFLHDGLSAEFRKIINGNNIIIL